MTKKPVGVLDPHAGATKLRLSLHPPEGDMAFFVEHYWHVAWDLEGRAPHLQETLPHPSVHLVVRRGETRIVGVVRGKFAILLEGKGQVFGVKWKPGGFRPFVSVPVARLTGRSLTLRDAFGVDAAPLEEAVLAEEEPRAMTTLVEALLRARRPARDPNVTAIARILLCIQRDCDVTKVALLAERVGVGARTLQRLFHDYVGVSPKWVIDRCRLHEAAEALASGERVDVAALAAALGYFDQAHFTRAFTALVGVAPAEYARRAGPAARSSSAGARARSRRPTPKEGRST